MTYRWSLDLRRPTCVLRAWTALACLALLPAAATAAEQPVEFSRDIRPILSNKCFKCHGPDEGQRQADLRLDTEEGALAQLSSGGHALVRGDSAGSLLYQRAAHEDPDQRMPPPDADKHLTPEEIALLKRWIDEGATWRGHWSFQAPQRSDPPEVKQQGWAAGAIDRFILHNLELDGLQPSPEADKPTLIRRVTLDLTGLPPTPAEVDAFLADQSPEAYRRLVDRLLASPRYGEHMARYWLDAARYGDTHGLHLDNERVIWPYRNWVIDAFNRNLPYDRFTVEQLAGDLLPNPTLDQRIATGFNRCNVTTSEGGAIDEEFYVRYTVDRVETTSTVFLGLTAGCAVCHDHKFDPISQREFYQLFAFFNSLTEKAMDGNAMDPPPVVRAASTDESTKLAALDTQIAEADTRVNGPIAEIDAAQQTWEAETTRRLNETWQTLAPQQAVAQGGAELQPQADGSLLAVGANPPKDTYEITAVATSPAITALRLEALTHESLPHTGPGRSDNANFVLSEIEIEAAPAAERDKLQKVALASAWADYSQDNAGLSIDRAIDGVVDDATGWAVAGYERRENRTAVFYPAAPIGYEGGTLLKIRLRFDTHFAQHAMGRLRLAISANSEMTPLAWQPWNSVGPFAAADGDAAYATAFPPEQSPARPDLAATFEGALTWQKRDAATTATAGEEKFDLTGENCATYLHRTVTTPAARTVRLLVGSDDALKIWLNGAVVHDKKIQRSLTPGEDTVDLQLVAGENHLLVKAVNYGGAYGFSFRSDAASAIREQSELAALLAGTPETRNPEQQKKIRDFFRERQSPEWRKLRDDLAALRQQKTDFEKAIPTTLVMQDMDARREAFILLRGAYDKRGEPVQPGVPAFLPPMAESSPRNRLGLAEWLVEPTNPLTARVAVNRFWQQFFGIGIVRTSEDFGVQGEWPTHPALLDWMATEFTATGWDVKGLVRQIVTSSTYRQSSRVTPELLEKDRENRLLARGPRLRLEAETVRDSALYLSGLLLEGHVGHGVRPYQPEGLWEAVGYTDSNTAKFRQDHGEALYRRSLYTFWKRTSPPPVMMIFDAPSREACTVRRPRTNTPLQALALLNDIQFVEAARKFAERIVREGGSDSDARLRYAFRMATARLPRDSEMAVLREQFAAQLAHYRAAPEEAAKLLGVGESPRDDALDTAALAAWTMMANLILNLDETITKG